MKTLFETKVFETVNIVWLSDSASIAKIPNVYINDDKGEQDYENSKI